MPPSTFRLAVGVAVATVLGACSDNNGSDPPPNRFFYPAALALHRAAPGAQADRLYVLNSDFDLAYNGSTVATVDLAQVRARRADHAGCRADVDARGAWVCDETPLVIASRTKKLNPYAVEAALVQYPRGQRLYTLVRGGNAVAWFDVGADGELDCGPADERGYCSATHYTRTGSDYANNAITLPQESSALSVDVATGYIALTHQSYDPSLPHASLLRDPFAGASSTQTDGPQLVGTLSGTAAALSSLVLLPPLGGRPTWLATSRAEAVFTLLQVYPGSARTGSDGGVTGTQDGREILYRAAATPITGINTGTNNRTIVLDPRPAASPARAYVVSRSPEALLTVDIRNPAAPTVTDMVPLPTGPSRAAAVWHASLGRTYVYALSYDTRWMYVIDPEEHRVVQQIATNRGPHNLVYDEVDRVLYVVDFLDASIELIDVDASSATFNRRVLTIGRLGRTRAAE